MNPLLIMPFTELSRIDQYREYLRSDIQTTNIGDGGRQKVAEVELELTHGLLVLEGVDEDAEDANTTFRDELIMLARDDPIWKEDTCKKWRRREN